MHDQQYTGREERSLRRYDYDDSWILAADLGVDEDDIDVDIVGTTAIVVVETGDRVTESEFELPSEDATVKLNNGVLTITVDK